MDGENNYQSIINQKCPSCYKKDWCMLSPYQRTVDCLGPFKDVEENNRKIDKDYQEESKPKADLDRVVCEVVKNTYLRKKKLFDEREKKKK